MRVKEKKADSDYSKRPTVPSRHQQLDITARFVAAEMGELTPSVYNFGITCKDGSLPLFPRTEKKNLYIYGKQAGG